MDDTTKFTGRNHTVRKAIDTKTEVIMTGAEAIMTGEEEGKDDRMI